MEFIYPGDYKRVLKLIDERLAVDAGFARGGLPLGPDAPAITPGSPIVPRWQKHRLALPANLSEPVELET